MKLARGHWSVVSQGLGIPLTGNCMYGLREAGVVVVPETNLERDILLVVLSNDTILPASFETATTLLGMLTPNDAPCVASKMYSAESPPMYPPSPVRAEMIEFGFAS